MRPSYATEGVGASQRELSSVDRAQITSLVAAIIIAALALHAALKITEPRGRTPTRRELISAQKTLDESYRNVLQRASEKLERAKKNVQEGDFRSHYNWANAYSLVLRYRRLSDTGGQSGQSEPDEEMLRILELCRECAKNERDDALLARFEQGRVFANAAPAE